ncbi:unnamed protein product [Prunus brigantina]
MVSKSQSKEAQASKGQVKDSAVLKAQSILSNPAKKMRFTSSAEKNPSSTTFDEVTKSTRGINTMSRVVKRKIQKIKHVVEYNKSGRPHGKASIEMQSYIGVLARTRGADFGSCSNGLCCWGRGQEDASRLSPYFEAVHSEQSQRREKCEYNHRLSRKGYVGLEDQLEETILGEEIDQSLLWKKEREDKHGNILGKHIPNPKVAEKAKLIISFTDSDLKKQVSEGTLTVSGSNDVLTLALGTLEHGGRVRGVGAGVSPTQFFNLPRQQRDLSKLDMPTPLLVLCQYVETKLKPANETIRIHMPEEIFGIDHDTWLLREDILQFASMIEIGSTVIAVYMRYLFDYLKMANMVNLVGLVDPRQVSSQSGMLSHRSKHLSEMI